MSNYCGKAKNPRTGKVEKAEFLDNYYGPHRYGVRFGGEQGSTYPVTYPIEVVGLPLCEHKLIHTERLLGQRWGESSSSRHVIEKICADCGLILGKVSVVGRKVCAVSVGKKAIK